MKNLKVVELADGRSFDLAAGIIETRPVLHGAVELPDAVAEADRNLDRMLNALARSEGFAIDYEDFEDEEPDAAQ